MSEMNGENGNVNQPVQQKTSTTAMVLKVCGILMAASVAIGCIAGISEDSTTDGGGNIYNSEVIEAAEKKAKSYVVKATNEIPELETEILDQTDEWALVLVRYKCEVMGGYIQDGCLIFEVQTTAYNTYVSAAYMESDNYDIELSEEDIEKIKVEWELY